MYFRELVHVVGDLITKRLQRQMYMVGYPKSLSILVVTPKQNNNNNNNNNNDNQTNTKHGIHNYLGGDRHHSAAFVDTRRRWV